MQVIKNEIPKIRSLANQRLAAKGLLALVQGRRETRMRAVTDLSEQIKQCYRSEIDKEVGDYIQ